MQIIRPRSAAVAQGYALIVTIVFLAVAVLIFAGIFSWTNGNFITTQRNNQYNMSENAAESAVEVVMGQMDRDFVFSTISNNAGVYASAYYASLPNTIDQTSWPIQYTFSGTNSAATNAAANSISVYFSPQDNSVVGLNSQFAGLSGQSESVDVYATATPTGQRYNVPATVHESLQFANIPLFQFAIFYNVNLEIDPGAAMTISGPVFCNQNIWEGSSVCTFQSTVTAAGTNAPQIADPFATSYNGSGASTFSGGAPLNKAQSLVMPIGTNNSPGAILGLLELPPPAFAMGTPAAYSSNGIAYPANGADLVISNFFFGTNDGVHLPTGTNLIAYYQDSSLTLPLTPLPYDYYIITNGINHTTFVVNYTNGVLLGPTTNIYFAGYTWVTNVAFYDWREGWNGGSGPAKRVEAVQIDMGKLNSWLTNQLTTNSGYIWDGDKVLHSGSHIASVYVYTSVPLTSSQLPAVRVTDGAYLPNPGNARRGFTVATQFPIYVLGDYNSEDNSGSALGSSTTTHTLPAALMGDSVTILSDSWQDSDTSKNPSPSSTTVNAAMLEGIVASNPSISGNYSGGVENFMRLLENWGSSSVLTYNGSIVVLFYSQWATNSWQPTGNYYNAPKRNWAFDLNFDNTAKLPPLTPDIKAMIRGNWYAHQ